METDELNHAEVTSGLSNDSDDPSTTCSEIRHRLGPLFDTRFILANNSWLGRVGTYLRHFSSAIPTLGYSFVLPVGRIPLLALRPAIPPFID